jgi:uncharacterized protein YbaR (Trm112 family)
MISPDLLRILVCPETHAPLVLTKDGHLLSTHRESRRLYRVEDGIPNLLIDESEVLGEQEYDRLMAESREAASRHKD